MPSQIQRFFRLELSRRVEKFLYWKAFNEYNNFQCSTQVDYPDSSLLPCTVTHPVEVDSAGNFLRNCRMPPSQVPQPTLRSQSVSWRIWPISPNPKSFDRAAARNNNQHQPHCQSSDSARQTPRWTGFSFLTTRMAFLLQGLVSKYKLLTKNAAFCI